MKANRKFSKDEEAVSPVIGVILMVAITVILAAVIAAFVFGMGGTLKKSYMVAATATQTDADTIEITYNGGPDHESLTYLNVSLGTYTNVNSTDTFDVSPKVGSIKSITDSTNVTTGRDHIIVTGVFADGTAQVILDTYV